MLISLSPPLAWLSFNTQSDRETETKRKKEREREERGDRQTDWLIIFTVAFPMRHLCSRDVRWKL